MELEKVEQWHKDLDEFAKKCTFWIFNPAYPWNHPAVPKNMQNNLTFMADGSVLARFKVIEGGKKYRLLQYRLRGWDGKLYSTDAGLLLRALQEHVWEQEWDDDIYEEQLREWMVLVGVLSCFSMRKAIPYIEEGKKIPAELTNRAAVTLQKRYSIDCSDYFEEELEGFDDFS
jgi:hypothetical protein